MKALALSGVMDCSALAMPRNNPGTVRLANFRKTVFTFEIAFSIGLKSGEYGGSRKTSQPAALINSSTRRSLCAARLSNTKT